MEKNVFFFQNFEWDGIFATHNFRKRQKERLKIFFTAILDRVWRFKGSKLGPGFQKLLKYN